MKVAVIVCALLSVALASVVRRQAAAPPAPAPAPAPAAPAPAGGASAGIPQTAYVLPDGAAVVIGNIQKSFTCDGKKYGYFADIANDCKIFHICVPYIDANGALTGPVQQYSFFCGNQTVFDQSTFVCKSVDSAIPCSQSESFFNLNDKFGVQGALFPA